MFPKKKVEFFLCKNRKCLSCHRPGPGKRLVSSFEVILRFPGIFRLDLGGCFEPLKQEGGNRRCQNDPEKRGDWLVGGEFC